MPKEISNQPWMYSTGPRTDEGKERSSRNSTKHGCTSRVLVLPDEDPEEWEALLQGWLDSYETETEAERRLVEEAAQADWFLQRNTRQYMAAERALHLQQANAVLWSDAQHKILLRFERYKAAAQRAFSQAVRLLEQVRKNRLMERDREHRAQTRTAHNGHQTPCALHGREMDRELREKRDARKAEIKEAEAALREIVVAKREVAVAGEVVLSVEDERGGAGEVAMPIYGERARS